MEEEKDLITIVDENGVEKKVEIITEFSLDMNGKDYVIYTENKRDEAGNVEIYTSEVVEKDNETVELRGIDDDEVWKEIKNVMVEMSEDGE